MISLPCSFTIYVFTRCFQVWMSEHTSQSVRGDIHEDEQGRFWLIGVLANHYLLSSHLVLTHKVSCSDPPDDFVFPFDLRGITCLEEAYAITGRPIDGLQGAERPYLDHREIRDMEVRTLTRPTLFHSPHLDQMAHRKKICLLLCPHHAGNKFKPYQDRKIQLCWTRYWLLRAGMDASQDSTAHAKQRPCQSQA